MGAGGSTAVSCSSLDINGLGANDAIRQRYYERKHRYQGNCSEAERRRLQQKYNKLQIGKGKAPVPVAAGDLSGQDGRRLKHYHSYYDLSNSNLFPTSQSASRTKESNIVAMGAGHHPSYLPHHYPMHSPPMMSPVPGAGAVSPVLHINAGAKKSNAGVANRILHQRQQQNLLRESSRKFSDSLPSLNNLPAEHNSFIGYGNQENYLSGAHNRSSNNDCYSSKYDSNINQQSGAKMQGYFYEAQSSSNHNDSSNLVVKNLVNNKIPPSSSRQNYYHNRKSNSNSNPNVPLVKRATSLSSLHNIAIGSSHHARPHHKEVLAAPANGCSSGAEQCKQQLQLQMLMQIGRQSRHPQQQRRPDSTGPISGSSCGHNYRHADSPQPAPSLSAVCDIVHHQQHKYLLHGNLNQPIATSSADICNRSALQLRSTASNNKPYRHHHSPTGSGCARQHQQQHLTPRQALAAPPPQAPLTKRLFRLSHNGGCQSGGSRKYKNSSKQQKEQQQQQGCQVLPPLPRSQSLHELIQLRATENGQRMRTTGTLRGPFAGADSGGNKVNLVVELLESRRQKKQQQSSGGDAITALVDHDDQHPTGGPDRPQQVPMVTDRRQGHEGEIGTAALARSGTSPSSASSASASTFSSPDDGICVQADAMSLSGDHQSTGGSRSSATTAGNIINVAGNVQQRIFKKQQSTAAAATGGNGAINRKRFSQQQQQRQHADAFGGISPTKGKRTGDKSCRNHNANTSLKRSLSHSALQSVGTADDLNGRSEAASGRSRAKRHSNHIGNNYNTSDTNDDGDESDDLNELAKFLYQFKMRQLKLHKDKGEDEDTVDLIAKGMSKKTKSSAADIPATTMTTGTATDGGHQQQSPNSTTSSSGFASSNSCTSHVSISSADDCTGGSTGAIVKTRSGPKIRNESSSGTADAERCPISGKLKLSSSLLSIVEEYSNNISTGKSAAGLHSSGGGVIAPTSGAGTGSTIMLSSPGDGLLQPRRRQQVAYDEGEDVVRATRDRLRARAGSGYGKCDDYFNPSGTVSNNSTGSGKAVEDDDDSDYDCNNDYDYNDEENSNSNNCRRRRAEYEEHLEKLKQYTQSRQISQSELALNHLANGRACYLMGKASNDGGDDERCKSKVAKASAKAKANGRGVDLSNHHHQEQLESSNNKRNVTKSSRANGLINLIRRISDKSALATTGGWKSGSTTALDKSGSGRSSSNNNKRQCDAVGGQRKLQSSPSESTRPIDMSATMSDAINQTGAEQIKSKNNKKAFLKEQQVDRANNKGLQASKFIAASELIRNKHQSINNGSKGKGNIVGDVHSTGEAAASATITKIRSGESLCNLNFDCDFELIKNFGHDSGNRAGSGNKMAPPTTGADKCCSASDRAGKTACLIGRSDPVTDSKQQRQQQHKAAANNSNNSNDDRSNGSGSAAGKATGNWRLLPTRACLLDSSAASKELLIGGKKKGATGRCNDDNNNNGLRTDSSKDQVKGRSRNVGRAAAIGTSSNDVPAATAGSKYKWSAWLMNGSNFEKNNNNKRDKSKLQQQQQQQNLPVLVDSVRSEADQLLDDLDHSLKRSSRRWWHQTDGAVPMSIESDGDINNSHLSGSMLSTGSGLSDLVGHCAGELGLGVGDVDRNFKGECHGRGGSSSTTTETTSDGDYASINKALIDETFDAKDLIEQQRTLQNGSPSDSFTFSATNSRSTSPTVAAHTNTISCSNIIDDDERSRNTTAAAAGSNKRPEVSAQAVGKSDWTSGEKRSVTNALKRTDSCCCNNRVSQNKNTANSNSITSSSSSSSPAGHHHHRCQGTGNYCGGNSSGTVQISQAARGPVCRSSHDVEVESLSQKGINGCDYDDGNGSESVERAALLVEPAKNVHAVGRCSTAAAAGKAATTAGTKTIAAPNATATGVKDHKERLQSPGFGCRHVVSTRSSQANCAKPVATILGQTAANTTLATTTTTVAAANGGGSRDMDDSGFKQQQHQLSSAKVAAAANRRDNLGRHFANGGATGRQADSSMSSDAIVQLSGQQQQQHQHHCSGSKAPLTTKDLSPSSRSSACVQQHLHNNGRPSQCPKALTTAVANNSNNNNKQVGCCRRSGLRQQQQRERDECLGGSGGTVANGNICVDDNELIIGSNGSGNRCHCLSANETPTTTGCQRAIHGRRLVVTAAKENLPGSCLAGANADERRLGQVRRCCLASDGGDDSRRQQFLMESIGGSSDEEDGSGDENCTCHHCATINDFDKEPTRQQPQVTCTGQHGAANSNNNNGAVSSRAVSSSGGVQLPRKAICHSSTSAAVTPTNHIIQQQQQPELTEPCESKPLVTGALEQCCSATGRQQQPPPPNKVVNCCGEGAARLQQVSKCYHANPSAARCCANPSSSNYQQPGRYANSDPNGSGRVPNGNNCFAAKYNGVKPQPLRPLISGSNLDPQVTKALTKLSSAANKVAPADKFDDNFILKRKTPSAGLKTRC